MFKHYSPGVKELVAFAIVLLLSIGCGGDAARIVAPDTVKGMESRIDGAIEQLTRGVTTFDEIKTILEGLKTNLDNGEYKQQVEGIVGRVGGVAQITGQSLIDFTRDRVVEDLQRLKAVVTGKQPPERKPVLTNAQMPAVDFTSPSRATLTVVGWNLDVAQQNPGKYNLMILNSGSPAERPIDQRFIAFQGQYAITVNVSNSGVPFSYNDYKIEYRGFTPAFSINVINSAPPPPVTITSVIIRVNTTRNDKDREVTFTYIVHKDGHGAVHNEALRRGDGEVWPDPSVREFKINVDRPFLESARQEYQLRVRYDSRSGDPNWIGRISVRGVNSKGREIPLLGETGDMEFGHHDGGKISERVQRELKFNQ